MFCGAIGKIRSLDSSAEQPFGALRPLVRSDVKAAIIAALFLIHPLHLEPVGCLSARKDIMNVLFFFATIWAYTRYAALPSWRRYTLVFLTFWLRRSRSCCCFFVSLLPMKSSRPAQPIGCGSSTAGARFCWTKEWRMKQTTAMQMQLSATLKAGNGSANGTCRLKSRKSIT